MPSVLLARCWARKLDAAGNKGMIPFMWQFRLGKIKLWWLKIQTAIAFGHRVGYEYGKGPEGKPWEMEVVGIGVWVTVARENTLVKHRLTTVLRFVHFTIHKFENKT
jgi:hypothetical protein